MSRLEAGDELKGQMSHDGSGEGEKSSNPNQISKINQAIWAQAVATFLCIIFPKASVCFSGIQFSELAMENQQMPLPEKSGYSPTVRLMKVPRNLEA